MASNLDGASINSRKLGNYLSKNQDKVASGYRIEQFGDRQKVALWRVVALDERGFRGFSGFVPANAGNFAVKENAKNIDRNARNLRNPPNSPSADDSRESGESRESAIPTRGNSAVKKNAKNREGAETHSRNSPNSPETPPAVCMACVHFHNWSYTCPHSLTGIPDPTTPPCGWQHFESKGK